MKMVLLRLPAAMALRLIFWKCKRKQKKDESPPSAGFLTPIKKPSGSTGLLGYVGEHETSTNQSSQINLAYSGVLVK